MSKKNEPEIASKNENKFKEEDDDLENENDNDVDYDTKINLENFMTKYDEINEDDFSQDSYEKRLDKEIEDNCDFKEYVDKLEVEEKDDNEILKLEKEQIIEFKNNQIKQYKNYIASLEREKQDQIENFKETTNVLLDKIKELEEKTYGERPQTAMIMENIKKTSTNKKGGSNSNYPNSFQPKILNDDYEKRMYGNNPHSKTNLKEVEKLINSGSKDKEMEEINDEFFEVVGRNKTKSEIVKNTNSEKIEERCIKCKKYFPKDEFSKHSLECLRKPVILCKICQESIDESEKENHIMYFRNPTTIKKAVDEKNIKLYENCLNHGFEVEKHVLETDKGYYLIHYICENSHHKYLNLYLKKKFNANLKTTITKESAMVRK